MPPATVGDGRYVLGPLLGAGGFARVYRATDVRLGSACAVKILTVPPAMREALRVRLRNEAHAMASVRHANVLRVVDTGSDGETDWIAMDLAEGGTLDDRVEADGPLSARAVALLGADVASALAAAHDAGIVHRDVKPSNLLLDQDGRVLLADFGIARMDGTDADHRQTRTDVAMGTMAFMAPEQRLDARSVSAAADQYALAATLYWLVSGWNPVDLFTATPDSPRWEPIPPVLARVLQRALRFLPAERWPDARSFEAALREVAGSVGDQAQRRAVAHSRTPTLRAGMVQSVPPPALRRPVPTDPDAVTLPPPELREALPARPRPSPVVGVSAAVVVAALVSLGVVAWRNREPPPAPEAASPAVVEVAAPAPPPAPAPAPVPTPEPVGEPPPEPVVVVAPAPVRPVVDAAPSSPDPDPRSAPAPAPTPAAGPFPIGSWTGSYGGRRCTVSLRGSPSALVGEVVVHFNERAVESPVTGHTDGATVTLEDVDQGPDSGSYQLSASQDGRRLEGRFSARHRNQSLPVVLSAP